MADTLGQASALQAISGYGFRFYYGTGTDVETATWTKIEGMKSGALPSQERPDIDVTTTEDEVKAYIKGTGDIPDMSLELNFYPDNSVHQYLMTTVLDSDGSIPWKIEYTRKGASVPSMVFKFLGYLKSAGPSFAVDSAVTFPLVLKATSKPVRSFGNSGSIAYNSTLVGEDSDGSVAGSLVGTFTAASGVTASFATGVTNGTTFTAGTHYTIANVPTGLTAVLTKTSPTVATLTFTGTASVVTDVSNITLTLLDAAFTGATALSVTGYKKSDIAITFA